MHLRRAIPMLAVLCLASVCCVTVLGEPAYYAGVDISMLPEIEKAGGKFSDQDKPGDAIEILRRHGCNLFRVRLFVQPSTDFNKSYGATQDLPYVIALAKRIAAAHAMFMLDIHYSDTWADGGKQFKPASWKELGLDQLEKRVYDYTADVLKQLQDAGAPPDIVQIGNEVAGGVLWPEGKVLNAPADIEKRQWENFARLVNAGARAVRAASTESHKIQVMIHIHGGGRRGLPKWFFDKFNRNPVDYDVIGLSFYPAWEDSIDALKLNMAEIIGQWHKDVIVAEISYPWKEMEGIKDMSVMRWPMTPAGQKQFLMELKKVIRDAPEGRGRGFVWWYGEAIPVPGRDIWRKGAEALFDEDGRALPALDAFAPESGGDR